MSMIRIYSTSRGKEIKESLNKLINLKVSSHVSPGGSMESIANQAQRDITNIDGSGLCIFVAGLPDLTEREKDYEENYEEVVYTRETPKETSYRLDSIYANASSIVKEEGWTPIFCTIIPMSLTDWNNTRLAQNKTHYLLHHNHYEDMQYHLNLAVELSNKSIVAINRSNHVHTPYLHNTIIKVDHQKHTYKFNRLVDGVHPNKAVLEQMSKIIYNAIKANIIKQKNSIFTGNFLTIPVGECVEENVEDYW